MRVPVNSTDVAWFWLAIAKDREDHANARNV